MKTINEIPVTEPRLLTRPSLEALPLNHLGISFTPTSRFPLPTDAPKIDKNKILVVDDEKMITEVLRRALQAKFPSEVSTAADGSEAIALLQKESFDMVISDIRMPQINGLGLFDWVASHIPTLRSRFLFMTGDTGSMEMTEKIARLGVRVLRKPFAMDLLMATCREYLPVRPQPILVH